MKKTLLKISAFLFFFFSAGWLWALIYLPLSWAPQRTALFIKKGMSTWDVGTDLHEKGLLKSPILFFIAAKATGTTIRSGEYELSPHLNLLDVLDALKNGGHAISYPVTFPEGFTTRQMAQRLDESNFMSAEKFMGAARDVEKFSDVLPFDANEGAETLEGFLFPDTYLIRSGEKPEQIIKKILKNFSRKLPGDFSERARKMGFSPYELLILASLVEKEARKQNEQSVVASVIVNRLRRHMRLQVDATVQYALGNDKYERLMHSDLKVESPYNTYLHKGLPPTPIANPGLSALRAVMNPAQTKFLYYVARPDGSHIFSTKYEDHVNAINKIRKGL